MACSHPLTIRPEYKLWNGSVLPSLYEYKVPCGYCLNCRVDKTNEIIDRANYEYCNRLSAAFVTFTYDDVHLIERCAVLNPQGGFMYDDNGHDTVVRTSINYKDIQRFLDNIRHYIKAHPEIQNVLCQPDFSYIYVGEYGDTFGRCHAHILFFGLDFAYCKKLIFEQWKYGLIDVLPLLDGGIRYVCKYMDKMEKGILAEMKYDFKGIARPKLKMSKGFGQGLLWKNVDDIVKNDYTYPVAHGKRRPISHYWRILLTGNVTSRDVTKETYCRKKPEYIAKQIARKAIDLKSYNLHRNYDIFDEDVQSAFSLRKARIREYNLSVSLHNKHVPVDDWKINYSKKGFKRFVVPSLIRSRFGNVTFNHDEIRKCCDETLRVLQLTYLEDLRENLPDVFFA